MNLLSYLAFVTEGNNHPIHLLAPSRISSRRTYKKEQEQRQIVPAANPPATTRPKEA